MSDYQWKSSEPVLKPPAPKLLLSDWQLIIFWALTNAIGLALGFFLGLGLAGGAPNETVITGAIISRPATGPVLIPGEVVVFRKSDGVKPAEPVQRDPVPPAAKYADVPLPSPHAGPGPGGNVATGSSVSIGKTVSITGQLSGSEDLTLDGQVEGRIDLPQNILTVGASGRIKAEIFAKVVVIHGHVTGNIAAAERIEIRESGQVQGDIVAPRIAIADGAQFKGSIDMQRAPAAVTGPAATAAPAAPAAPAVQAKTPEKSPAPQA